MPDGRLLLVSNRLPVTVRAERDRVEVARSAGGLATGLRGLHERSESLWVGWPGDLSGVPEGRRAEVLDGLAALRTVPIELTQGEIDRYYEGFSNGVLWPLFHYLLDRIPLDARGWGTYRRVNERFADVVAAHARPGDTVWIHDYQLCLVPELLRARVPGLRVGFFLHIPFPSSEVFRLLPWREELLRGVLGADLVGLHTFSYARHFATALLRILGLEPTVDRVAWEGREVRFGVFPMGIDAASFEALGAAAETQAEAARVRREHGGRRLLLGVDRLDYTKGIPRRLLAFDRFLERNPEARGKVELLQLAVPSRAGVDAYREFRREVEALVGRINGTRGTVDWAPIHYLHRSVSEAQLVALYRAADVMLVTPLRDGMNLVAKEYVAARGDEDGVLVLSEFAGAASELGEALIVNPYDVDRTAAAIERALEMPPDERATRMRALRRRVSAATVQVWADAFVRALEALPAAASPVALAPSPAPALAAAVRELAAAGARTLVLDYDGTLMPFAEMPELAPPDAALLRLLRALAGAPGTSLVLASGRSREDLARWFGRLPAGLCAEHGRWYRPAGAADWAALHEGPLDWKERVRPILEQFCARTPGTRVEEKTASLAWHYRLADPEYGTLQARELRQHLTEVLANLPVEVLTGAKVVEARAQGVHKGLVIRRLQADAPGAALLAMGDDTTDEDLFRALPPGGLAVHVGPGPSLAPLRVADPRAARELLRALARALAEGGSPAAAGRAARAS